MSTPDITDCPPPPELPVDQLVAKAGEIAKAMGVQSCNTSQTSATAKVAVDAWVAAAEAEFTFNTTSTVGCEQLIINASEYNQTQQNITCIINKSSQKATVNTKVGNSIEFKAGKEINIDCGKENASGFKINQNIDLDSVSSFQFSSETVSAIANQTKDAIAKTTKTFQDSKNGLGATPQGSKVINDEVTNINNIDYGKLVNDSLKELNISTDAQNNITFTAGGNINVKGNNCVLDQNILVKLVANSIMNDAYSQAFKNISEKINTSDNETTQKSENKGAESLSTFGQFLKSRSIAMVIMIIAVVAGFALVVYFVFRNPENVKNISNAASDVAKGAMKAKMGGF